MHVLTRNNVKHGVLAYKVVQQGSPSLKPHDQKAMEWSGHRAFRNLRVPHFQYPNFTELPPCFCAMPSATRDSAASSSARHLEDTSDNADLGFAEEGPKEIVKNH